MISEFFNPHRKSLARGTILVFVSLAISVLLSDFPHNRATPWHILPLVGAIAGTIDHLRCMKTRWSWYHGGVILLVYTDLMAISMILFFLLYPYAQWLTKE